MTAIVTADQMRESERIAIDAGRPVADLMRTAAERIADWLDASVVASGSQPRRVTGLVGPGNNGGDALVALALLVERGWKCSALYAGRSTPGELPVDSASLERIQVIDELDSIADSDVIVDGIYGNGGRADLDTAAVDVIEAAREARRSSRTPLVAIDAPTGVDSTSGEAHEQAFPADVTLCIQFPKIGLIREPAATLVGEIVVLDIGLPEPDDFDGPRMIDGSDVGGLLPVRRATAHKGDTGGLLIVGGAPMYYGAPRLAAESAVRAGCGLVALAAPRSVIPAIAPQVPEVIYHPLGETDDRQLARTVRELIENDESRYTAVTIGPGIGRDEHADSLLSGLFGVSSRRPATLGFQIPATESTSAAPGGSGGLSVHQPLVIDADALNWLAEREHWPQLLSGLTVVLTPHPGEMARLLGDEAEVSDVRADPISVASSAAREWGQIVVLKGGYTCVALPDGSVWLSPRAASELATAGTGDVLAGLIGGLLAQGLQPADAARAALYLGAIAGQRAVAELGTISVVARDVVKYLPGVIRDLQSPKWSR